MLDNYIFSQINNLAGKYLWLDALGIFCAKYLPYLLIAFLFLLLLKDFKKNKKIILITFLTAGFSRIVVEIIRLFYFCLRPFVENQVNLLLLHPNTASFPSAHSAFFFALSAFIYFYSKKKYSSICLTRIFWRRVGIWFFIFSSLIAVSRVFVGIHWPSDILIGAILGILFAYFINRLFLKH